MGEQHICDGGAEVRKKGVAVDEEDPLLSFEKQFELR